MMIALIALAAQAASTPTANPAVTPATAASDARCMAAFAVLADSDAEKVKDAGVKGVLYFAGKLLGRNPAIDLAAALRQGATEITPQLEAETLRCNADFGAMGEALSAAGKQD